MTLKMMPFLLQKGGDLQVFQFKTEDMKKVEKMAKKYGILYSVLPDINRKDGMSEIIFHTEAVPRVNMMIQKLKYGKVAAFDDYLKNGDEKSLGKLMDFLKKQQGKDKSPSAIDGLIEKVGMYAMEKKSVSARQVSKNFSSTVAVIHSLAWWAAVKSTVRPPLPMAMASISRPKAVVPMLRLLHTG